MTHCCVPFCESVWQKNIGISFHEFPCNKDVRSAWLKAIFHEDFHPNDKSNSDRVCSKHFTEDDYKPYAKNRLKPKSVPSVFPKHHLNTDPSEEKSRKTEKQQLDETEINVFQKRQSIISSEVTSRKRNEGSQDGSDANGREVKRSRSNPLPRKFDKSSRAKYDNRGYEKDTGLDLCDCLIEDCPGCWTDCPGCGSRKCGHECRVFRKYKYDSIEIEGANMTVKYNSK